MMRRAVFSLLLSLWVSLALAGGFTSGVVNVGSPLGVLPVANGGTGATTLAGVRSSIGAAASGANSDITSLTGLSTALPVSEGGTGATTAGAALSALGGAARGANSDITSLTGLSTALPVSEGGTGATTAGAALSALGGAPLASPTFTGAPAAPTAAVGTATTQLATTAFVNPGSGTGYRKFPDGNVMQWGCATASGSGYSNLTFPVAWPTGLYSIVGTVNGGTPTPFIVEFNVASATTTTVPFAALTTASAFSAQSVCWIATGH